MRIRKWWARCRGLLGKERCDAELAAELDNHLQLHIEENLRRGMTPGEARRQALIALGGVEQTKERYREGRGILWIETLTQDVHFSARVLRKNPGFTAIVVLTLALGAQPRQVFQVVLLRGTVLAAAGLVIGFGAAIGLTRVIASMLFDVSPLDAPTFAAVGVLFMLVVLLACLVPARRAMRVDPMVALRHQ